MKTMQGKLRAAMLMAAAVSVLVFAAGAKAQDHNDKGDNNQWSNDNSWQHDNQSSNDNSAPHDNPWPYAATGKSPVLAVVGDISCQPGVEATGEAGTEVCTDPSAPYTNLWESQVATANQIEAMKPDAVALLGDLQYQVGRYSDFKGSFDLTYGAFKFITRPAPGNHEFYDEHGETGVVGYGYFSYYNGFQVNPDGSIPMFAISDPCPTTNASCKPGKNGNTPTNDLVPQPVPLPHGQAGKFEASGGLESLLTCSMGTCTPTGGTAGLGEGWYSYNIGSWHLISLNIECYTQPDKVGTDGCLDTNAWLTAETEWLKKDLEEDHSACTLAYWHQPTYSGTDGLTEEGITAGTWWQILYDHKADLVLNGHDHLYARYAPIKPYFDAADTSVTGVTGTWLGTSDPDRGIREFIVGTGGETLDPVVNAAASTTDWDGIFNSQFLQAATGDYWGVMKLTLDPNGYKWDFESAPTVASPILTSTTPTVNGPQIPAPASTATSYSDKGVGYCHGGPSPFGF